MTRHPATPHSVAAPAEDVEGLVRQWVADGVLDPAWADRVRSDLRTTAARAHPTAPHGSVLVEALGYLGGVVVVVGAVSVAAQYWEELATVWRVAVVGATAAALLAAGALAPVERGEVPTRLRAVLWLGSTVATAWLLAVLAGEVWDLDGADTFVVAAAGTAAYATGLWAHTRTLLQQVALAVSLAVTAAALVNRLDVSDDLPGLGVWGVGLVWALFGWGAVVGPRVVVLPLGVAMAIFGGMLTAGADAGLVLALVTVAAAVGASLALHDLVLLGVATLGAVLTLPAAMTRWFPDSLVGPFVLVAAGLVLVALATWTARRRTEPTRREVSFARGSRTMALMASAVVVIGVAVTVAVAAAG